MKYPYKKSTSIREDELDIARWHKNRQRQHAYLSRKLAHE
jgi:hypothetical protein